VVLCMEYRSTSKYQLKRIQYVYITLNWNLPFCSYHAIILSTLYSLSLPFFFEKNYTALLTESFYVSLIYLKMHTRQIANHPSPENFLSSPLPLHWRSSVYWRSRLRIKLRGFVFREYFNRKIFRGGKFQVCEQFTIRKAIQVYKAPSWLVITKVT